MAKNGKPNVSQDDILIKLFNEVEYVWPQMGYPPLVTPFSQYVKNVALMNVTQMEKGKARWSMIDENTWGMLMGRSGQLLGPLGEDLQALAISQNREPYTGNPQDLYPDELELFAAEMEKNGWDYGEDDEELFELAMHPAQYKDYKSGKAKEKFNADLAERKAKKNQSSGASTAPVIPASAPAVSIPQPRNITVDVDGEKFKVNISYDDTPSSNGNKASSSNSSNQRTTQNNTSAPASLGNYQTIEAPLEGKFYLTKESSDRPVKIGDMIHEGDTVAYIESMKVINAIAADKSGKIVEITAKHGEDIEEDDVMFKIV
jgi:pyruvate carboxylase subunit B